MPEPPPGVPLVADGLTIVGAVTGPLALGWHVWTWWYRQRLSVHVTAWTVVGHGPSWHPVSTMPDQGSRSLVRVRVVNRGGRTVKVEGVGWVDPTVEASATHLPFRGVEETELDRHDGATFDEMSSRLEHADLRNGQTFYVRLATGETLYARGIEVERSRAAGRNPLVKATHKPPLRMRLQTWWMVNRGRLRWWFRNRLGPS